MTEDRLRTLLEPFLDGSSVPKYLFAQLAVYLELLLRWNAKTNLTAVRDPEEMVTRHFGEGLFAAARLRELLKPGATLLDLGSGAGFPGLPIQLALPEVTVTLAESQGKKASFLREAVRVLGCGSEVWGKRVEDMPAARRFRVVTLRAVDRMSVALEAGTERLAAGGVLAELTVANAENPARLVPFAPAMAVPGSQNRVLRLWSEPVP